MTAPGWGRDHLRINRVLAEREGFELSIRIPKDN